MLWEKIEDALLVRLANPALGDQACNKLTGCNVETVVRGRAVGRRHPHFDMRARVHPVGVAHFFRTAFLDRYLVYAITNLPIKGRGGKRYIKWDAVIFCGKRFEIGADLVGNIAGLRRPIGPHDHGVYFAALHQMATRIIRDDGVRHAMFA